MTTLRSHVAKVVNIWKRSNGMFYRTRRILRTLLLLIIGCSKGCSKSPVHFFRRNRKLAPKLDRPKDESFFRNGIRKLPERWVKVVMDNTLIDLFIHFVLK